MIAIVTSTMIAKSHSFFSKEERIKQTIHTLDRLTALGFSDIFLFDNSIVDIKAIIATLPPVKIYHAYQYTFDNKGLNEALLILNNIHLVPSNTPIFKISARYYPNENFKLSFFEPLLEKNWVLGTGGNFDQKVPYFNTRAYFIRDKAALETILCLSVEEMLSYSKGIHGVRSFFEVLKRIFIPFIGSTYQISLEQAFARVIRSKSGFRLLEKIDIEGYLAGSDHLEFINE